MTGSHRTVLAAVNGPALAVVSLIGGRAGRRGQPAPDRRAIAPMARPTAIAEEIARTEDLQLPYTVSGRAARSPR